MRRGRKGFLDGLLQLQERMRELFRVYFLMFREGGQIVKIGKESHFIPGELAVGSEVDAAVRTKISARTGIAQHELQSFMPYSESDKPKKLKSKIEGDSISRIPLKW